MSASDHPQESDLDFGPTLRMLREGAKVFGRYQLVRQLGRGGMGVVWLAQDQRLDLDIALKFLPENLIGDDGALADLRQETRRCMKLHHTHIVHVYDFLNDEHTAAISMEFVDGKPLSALRVEQPGRAFAVEALSPLVRQACEALQYAHEFVKLVHHDLKPANMMLTKEGILKVMDFGIASSLSESLSRHSRTSQPTSGSGTLPYMSPQQLMGFPPSVLDDVYGLGATLYDLLTGKPPFFRGDLTRQIDTVVPPSIMARREELQIEGVAPVPAHWEQTVAACLEKEPERRPRNAAEIWERLSAPQGAPVVLQTVVQNPDAAAVVKTQGEESHQAESVPIIREVQKAVEDHSTVELAALESASVSSDEARHRTDTPSAKAPDVEPQQAESVPVVRKVQEAAVAPSAIGTAPGSTSGLVEEEERRTGDTRPVGGRGKTVLNILSISALLLLVGVAVWFGTPHQPLSTESEAGEKITATTTKPATDRPPVPPTPFKKAGDTAGDRQLLEIAPGVSIPFRWCPPGSFTMGSPSSEMTKLKVNGRPYYGEYYIGEKQHHVTLTRGFWLAETTVTQGQWESVMGLNLIEQVKKDLMDDLIYTFSQGPRIWRDQVRLAFGTDPATIIGQQDQNFPMYFVSWDEANEFCRRATRMLQPSAPGMEVRLPTEAQWEYACRAGTKTMTYAGDFTIKGEANAPGLDDIAWYAGNSSVGYDGPGLSTDSWKEKQYPGGTASQRQVGTKRPNQWGLYDMIGNVHQWCADYSAPYPSGDFDDPTGPSEGFERVTRGGTWREVAAGCRAAARGSESPPERLQELGFRIALIPSR